MRAFVTGAAGFLGSNLVDRLLAEGWAVDGIDDLSAGALANLADARAVPGRRFSFHRLDVCSPAVSDLIVHRRPDVVFHLAAATDRRASLTRAVRDAEVNVLGTLHVLEGARVANVSKVVFTSSGADVYGVPEELPVRESHLQRPDIPHGVAKMAATAYLNAYRASHGVEYTALALGHVYGVRCRGDDVVGTFASRLLHRQRCVILGDGKQTRDFLFVDDAVDAIARAADRGTGLLLNIGCGVETSIQELYDCMARLVGVTDPPRYEAARPADVRRVALDPARAEIHLGWKPFTSLEEGLARTLEWAKSA